MTYAKGFDFGNIAEAEKEETVQKQEQKTPGMDLTQRKNVSLNLENLMYQQKTEEKEVIESKTPQTQTLKELLEQARAAEINYHYIKVVELLNKAALKTLDADYQIYIPVIYSRLAYAYHKVADYENAINFYQKSQKTYEERSDFAKVSQIKYRIARIYSDTFKIENAKELFLQISQDEAASVNLRVKSFLQLANIEEGLSNNSAAFSYYKSAIEFADETVDVETLSEIYFKYALAFDDRNDVKSAIEYYSKCIELNSDYRVNKFLSPTYSNIATLYMDKNDLQNAVLNYVKAFEIDKASKNTEGMYYSASKLAAVLQRRQPEEALGYFHIALDCAKQTKDVFYIVSASLAIGDFYYDRKQDEYSLKHYLFALDLANKNFSKDNIDKINIRINDIKFRMGVDRFDKLAEIIREKNNE
jgi:tetratricopeptide (TPR) repeat protein